MRKPRNEVEACVFASALVGRAQTSYPLVEVQLRVVVTTNSRGDRRVVEGEEMEKLERLAWSDVDATMGDAGVDWMKVE